MEEIEHPFLKLDPKYLYKDYRYKLKFYRTDSKYNWKKHIYENYKKEYEATAVFSHQTNCYYMFRNPTIKIKKENLLVHEAMGYEGGILCYK